MPGAGTALKLKVRSPNDITCSRLTVALSCAIDALSMTTGPLVRRRTVSFAEPFDDHKFVFQQFRELTLIENEALVALRGLGIALSAAECRRNIVTSGVPLNHLVGRELFVGTVRLRGIRLCEPCKYLDTLTREGTNTGLVHRGGLRTVILSDGIIRSGDLITPA